jgi:DNA-binding NtrC family response regulator
MDSSGSSEPEIVAADDRSDRSEGVAAKTPRPADIVLLSAEWPSRALLRAQLIEEGVEVVATDGWTTMRRYLRPGSTPRFAIVDLHGLTTPERVLKDLSVLMKPDRVLVLTDIVTLAPDAIERLGFRVLKRPLSIGRVVAAVVRALEEQGTEDRRMSPDDRRV